MAQAVILITASRGCSIVGSGTVSTRTSPFPCQQSARIDLPPAAKSRILQRDAGQGVPANPRRFFHAVRDGLVEASHFGSRILRRSPLLHERPLYRGSRRLPARPLPNDASRRVDCHAPKSRADTGARERVGQGRGAGQPFTDKASRQLQIVFDVIARRVRCRALATRRHGVDFSRDPFPRPTLMPTEWIIPGWA